MHDAASALGTIQPTFYGNDAWVRRHLQDRDAELARRHRPDGGFISVETVRFNRAEFTRQIQELLDADVSDGFVIGLKRRREFALHLCEDYKLAGRVRVYSVNPYTLCEGQTFGERESLNDEPVAFTVQAETGTHLLLLPYTDVKQLQVESSALRDYVSKYWKEQHNMSVNGSFSSKL
ncbi:hypothetical protein PsorP6_005278 [Peronosclerospora sorghi]|uniref:Uncharacterized protein n=1 Tax=Peronosclerospora sorghi TaxID=230839 RepID=A0ACC0W506_9STRA|nr:hypothetical protein PsorP6_005278 [Peronosclerospora sorghi]